MRKNGCVNVGNTEMFYAAFGNGSRKMIVLPGLSDGLATVKGKAWILASSYKCFFKDYTVYMFSRKNQMPEAYTIRDMARDQVEAMKTLGIEKAFVMGVSQGGMIAQYMAADHTETVEKAVLAVTAPYANKTVRKNIANWIDMAEKGDHKALMTDSAEKMYSEKYLKKYRIFLPLLALSSKPSDYDRFLKNAHAILDFDAREELDKIRCPVYIIAGSEDHTVGENAAYELKQLIPDSELYVYEGLGHGAYEEAEDFYDRVFRYCDE